MRIAVLIWCLLWSFAISQGLAKKAFAANNPELQPAAVEIDSENAGTSQPARMIELRSFTTVAPTKIPVPSLAGMPLSRARQALLKSNLTIGRIETRESDRQPETVISQSPKPRTGVLPGSAVDLVIAKPSRISIPSLIGLPLNEARTVLRRNNLQTGKVENRESDRKPDTVIDQFPNPRASALQDSEVDLVIAKPRTVIVPDVTGRDLNEARSVVKQAGLVPLDNPATGQRTDAIVESQNPGANDRVNRGSRVILRWKPVLVEVPPLTGLPEKQAVERLAEAGLRADPLTRTESGGEPGIVLRHSPEAGASLNPGSAVELTISTRTMVEVPSVVGLTLAGARDLVEGAGLVPVDDSATSEATGFVVERQQPEATSSVLKGSSVLLTLRAEPPASSTMPPAQPPEKPDLPLLPIITGAAVVTILAGGFLLMRNIDSRPPATETPPRVSIRANPDHGEQQLHLERDHDKPPTITIVMRPDSGVQQIRHE